MKKNNISDEDFISEDIFTQIRNISEGKPQSYGWYRKQIKSYAKKRSIIEDIYSLKDLLIPNVGELYFFEYDPLHADKLPIYDAFPLVYVLKLVDNGFFGGNLHYLKTEKARMNLILSLDKARIKIPKKTLKRYRYDRLEIPLMHINKEDWMTSIFLPVEKFHKK